MLELNKIYNEDCVITMQNMVVNNIKIDVVLTSPPYNISRVSATDKYNSRYSDSFKDLRNDEEYIEWSINIFNNYNKVLKKDGCILYNVSYSSENTQMMWLLIAEVIKKTEFTTADCIIWKKNCAIPNNRSKNKLTRICEMVFVFCRKSEIDTFHCNKKVISTIKKTGQNNYENIFNFIEAKNNDGANELNKATFSVEFCEKLLDIYAKKGSLVYDSFMGTGTTASACKRKDIIFIGSELSEKQVEYANKRLAQKTLFEVEKGE